MDRAITTAADGYLLQDVRGRGGKSSEVDRQRLVLGGEDIPADFIGTHASEFTVEVRRLLDCQNSHPNIYAESQPVSTAATGHPPFLETPHPPLPLRGRGQGRGAMTR